MSAQPPYSYEQGLGAAALEGKSVDLQTATSQHLASLVFLSYRLSQGGIGTQNRMLLYIEEHSQPGLFKHPQVDEVHTLTWKMIAPYFLNQKLHPATAIPWEDDSPEAAVKTERLVTNELIGLFGRFEDRTQIEGFESTPAAIAQSVIVMDNDYLNRPNGRAGDSEDLKIKVSPYPRDPYESMYIKYAVLGTNTNSTEFDEIFSQLATEEVISEFDVYTLNQLQSVVDIYILEHPGSENDERIERLREQCARLIHGK